MVRTSIKKSKPRVVLRIEPMTTWVRKLYRGIAKYSQQQQLQLKNQAEKHAAALGQYTTEPYHTVTACRAYCSELSEIQEQRNE